MAAYHTTNKQIEELKRQLQETKQKESVWHLYKMGPRLKQVCFLLITGMLLFAISQIWIDKAAGRIPELFGYQLYHIASGSMEPTLPVGSLIVSSKITKEDVLRVGDVITYRLHDAVITHRIIETGTDENGIFYRTKGDHPFNDIDPQAVRPDQVIAKYRWSLPVYIQTAAERKINDGI